MGKGSSVTEELERLANLHRDGVLSEAEFEAAKRLLLERENGLLALAFGLGREQVLSAFAALTGISAVTEGLIAHAIIGGTALVTLILYVLPLAVSTSLIILTAAGLAEDLGWFTLLPVAAILYFTIAVQSVLPEKHVMPLKFCWLSGSGQGLFRVPPSCTDPGSGFILFRAVGEIVEVLNGYWNTFGPGLFLVSVATGAGLMSAAVALLSLSQREAPRQREPAAPA
jgi:hypothetical protein